jgi:hypothetical protein
MLTTFSSPSYSPTPTEPKGRRPDHITAQAAGLGAAQRQTPRAKGPTTSQPRPQAWVPHKDKPQGPKARRHHSPGRRPGCRTKTNPKGQRPDDITAQAAGLGTAQRQTPRAQGSTTSQPRPQAWVPHKDKPRGLKARPIPNHPARTKHRHEKCCQPPATVQNPSTMHNPNQIKFSEKWHSSFTQSAILKVVRK